MGLTVKIVSLIVSIQALVISASSAAILLEERGRAVNSINYEVNSASHGFRKTHRAGVGFGLAGLHGLAGVQLELNFIPEVSFVGGVGLGSGFETFHLQLKKILAGNSFSPYISGGFARWHSSGESGSRNSSQPGFLAKKFLSGSEKRSGEFAETLLYPAVGIQYLKLNGEWAGASLYAEVILLIDIEDFVAAPTGGVGLMYYF